VQEKARARQYRSCPAKITFTAPGAKIAKVQLAFVWGLLTLKEKIDSVAALR